MIDNKVGRLTNEGETFDAIAVLGLKYFRGWDSRAVIRQE